MCERWHYRVCFSKPAEQSVSKSVCLEQYWGNEPLLNLRIELMLTPMLNLATLLQGSTTYLSNARDLTKARRQQQRERQKAVGWKGKTTTLHVHHAFLYISLQSLHNNDEKWPKFESLPGNGNSKAINSTVSVWIRARSLLFSSNPKSLLLINWALNKDNREKKWKDANSIFQWRFHGRLRCRSVRSLLATQDGANPCRTVENKARI